MLKCTLPPPSFPQHLSTSPVPQHTFWHSTTETELVHLVFRILSPSPLTCCLIANLQLSRNATPSHLACHRVTKLIVESNSKSYIINLCYSHSFNFCIVCLKVNFFANDCCYKLQKTKARCEKIVHIFKIENLLFGQCVMNRTTPPIVPSLKWTELSIIFLHTSYNMKYTILSEW